jgi:hypothetical protein
MGPGARHDCSRPDIHDEELYSVGSDAGLEHLLSDGIDGGERVANGAERANHRRFVRSTLPPGLNDVKRRLGQ